MRHTGKHGRLRAAARCVAGIAPLVLGSCASPPDVGVGRLHVCRIEEGPRGDYCGSLTVAEDRDAPKGRTIDLKIVVARALRRDPKPDPLFILYGGPTGGAATMAGSLAPMFRVLQSDRDIVFVDQRGTGASNALDCEPPERTLEALVEVPVERFHRCIESLDADPRFYS